MREGWRATTIGGICTVISGQSPNGKNYNDVGNGLPFYQGKKDFGAKYIGVPRVWTTQITKEAKAGDILMSVRAPVGPINVSTEVACIGRGLAAIRASDAVNREFLFYGLLNKQREISGNEGVVFPSINKKQIENIDFSLPPLPEQKRIVAILDEAFEGIDAAIANTKKNLANAKELFKSILESTLDRKDYSKANTTLGESCEFFNGKAHEKAISDSGEYIVVNSKFISTEGEVIKKTNDQMFPLVVNDIAMVMSDVPKGKALAKCYIIESDDIYSLNQRICCIRSNSFLAKYLYYQLDRHPFLLAFDNKGSQANLRKGDILSCPLQLLDMRTQFEVVDKLNGAKENSLKLENSLQQKLDSLKELKQSLLAKAFSGELTAQLDRVLKESVA